MFFTTLRVSTVSELFNEIKDKESHLNKLNDVDKRILAAVLQSFCKGKSPKNLTNEHLQTLRGNLINIDKNSSESTVETEEGNLFLKVIHLCLGKTRVKLASCQTMKSVIEEKQEELEKTVKIFKIVMENTDFEIKALNYESKINLLVSKIFARIDDVKASDHSIFWKKDIEELSIIDEKMKAFIKIYEKTNSSQKSLENVEEIKVNLDFTYTNTECSKFKRELEDFARNRISLLHLNNPKRKRTNLIIENTSPHQTTSMNFVMQSVNDQVNADLEKIPENPFTEDCSEDVKQTIRIFRNRVLLEKKINRAQEHHTRTKEEVNVIFNDYIDTIKRVTTKENIRLRLTDVHYKGPLEISRINGLLFFRSDYNQKISQAYGAFCMGLCRVFNLKLNCNSRDINQKCNAAILKIENEFLGQKLYDILTFT